MTQLASVTQLSPATRAIVAFHGSGKVQHVTLIRGRDAFALDDRESQKLVVALVEARVPRGEE